MPDDEVQEVTYTPKEIAEKYKHLGVTRDRVYKWVQRGKLPAQHVGGSIRIKESDAKKIIGIA